MSEVFLHDDSFHFYYTLKTNFSDRMNYHYGYCYKNGFGFIKYINKKYKLRKNIKVFNSVEDPNSEWFFYKPNTDYYLKKTESCNCSKSWEEKLLRGYSIYLIIVYSLLIFIYSISRIIKKKS